MAEEKTTSFANIHGEDWEVKEISVYGAAKAFIRQLSVGMDLTHVSIPAIFLLPYSILEFVAVRMTSAFHLLLDLPKEKDPRKRLEGVLQYALGSSKPEDLTLNHKPSNSVLGEVHKARCDHGDGTHSYVMCEQVCSDTTKGIYLFILFLFVRLFTILLLLPLMFITLLMVLELQGICYSVFSFTQIP